MGRIGTGGYEGALRVGLRPILILFFGRLVLEEITLEGRDGFKLNIEK
jgi:hypothetical protein